MNKQQLSSLSKRQKRGKKWTVKQFECMQTLQFSFLLPFRTHSSRDTRVVWSVFLYCFVLFYFFHVSTRTQTNENRKMDSNHLLCMSRLTHNASVWLLRRNIYRFGIVDENIKLRACISYPIILCGHQTDIGTHEHQISKFSKNSNLILIKENHLERFSSFPCYPKQIVPNQ